MCGKRVGGCELHTEAAAVRRGGGSAAGEEARRRGGQWRDRRGGSGASPAAAAHHSGAAAGEPCQPCRRRRHCEPRRQQATREAVAEPTEEQVDAKAKEIEAECGLPVKRAVALLVLRYQGIPEAENTDDLREDVSGSADKLSVAAPEDNCGPLRGLHVAALFS